jgi:RNA polymerase sigma-70 factor (ECF subfamily)
VTGEDPIAGAAPETAMAPETQATPLEATEARAPATTASKRAMVVRLLTEKALRNARALARNYSDAEDLAQEIVLRALRGLDSLSGDDEPLVCAWLERVARTTAIDAYRAQARHHSDREPVDADFTPAPSAERVALGRLAWQMMVDAIATMPPKQAKVLRLRLRNGMPAAAVAAELGITEAAVRTRMHRARTMLVEATSPVLDIAGTPPA